MQLEMRNMIKLFLSILIVLLLIAVIQKIQLSDTTTIDMDYYTNEEMAILYLYYIK